jgi:hypothetical protein
VRAIAGAASLFLAGAGCILSVETSAGQLSFAPNINFTVDDDSNRNLEPEGPGSQSASIQVSADIKGSTETNDFTFSPLLRYQYFDSSVFANIFERDMGLTDVWTLERGKLTLTGEDADHSTLSTEATETGILSSQLHQRQNLGGLSYTYDQTERLFLIVSGSYADVSYYGTTDSFLLNLLSGYRYPSGSVGELYQLSETSTIQADVSYSKILSQLPEFESRDTGVDLEYHRSISETFDLSATIGATEVRSATTDHLTTGALSLSRSYAWGNASVSYTRSLSPYGTGNLVQRQQFTVSASKALSDQLSVSLSLNRVQNGHVDVSPELGLPPQVQTYDNAQLVWSWQFAEFWHLNAEADTTRTQALGFTNQTVQEWRAALSLAWSPRPRTTQF